MSDGLLRQSRGTGPRHVTDGLDHRSIVADSSKFPMRFTSGRSWVTRSTVDLASKTERPASSV